MVLLLTQMLTANDLFSGSSDRNQSRLTFVGTKLTEAQQMEDPLTRQSADWFLLWAGLAQRYGVRRVSRRQKPLFVPFRLPVLFET